MRMRVRNSHGIACIYIPAYLQEQFNIGEIVAVRVGKYVSYGKVVKNGKKVIIALPYFCKRFEGKDAEVIQLRVSEQCS